MAVCKFVALVFGLWGHISCAGWGLILINRRGDCENGSKGYVCRYYICKIFILIQQEQISICKALNLSKF